MNRVDFIPSGSDDWPALNALMVSVTPGTEIHFAPATYRCGTRVLLRSQTKLFLHGAQIVCSLPKSTDPGKFLDNEVFGAWPVMFPFTTKLVADAPRGALAVTLPQLEPHFTVGSFLQVYKDGGSTSKLGSTYICVGLNGNVVYLDRPLSESFTVSEATVAFPVEPVRGIRIIGDGAIITGTGDGVVEFSSPMDCLVEGITAAGDFASPTVGGKVFGMDVFGVRNVMRDLVIDQRAGGFGFSLETNELSVMERCWDSGGRPGNPRAIWVGSCHDSVVRDCHAGVGTVSSVDGSDNRVEGGSFVGGTNSIILGGDRNRLNGVHCGSTKEHAVIIAAAANDTAVRGCTFTDTGLEAICVLPGAQRYILSQNAFSNCNGTVKPPQNQQ